MTEIPAAGSIRISTITGDAVIRVAADATVADVATAIVEREVGSVVVGDDPHPEGLVTERDVARVVAAGQNPAEVRAAEVASKNLIWCRADDTVAKVATRMMDRYIRHVLVERNGELIGVVSARDLLGVYAADAEQSALD
ncbi:cyclic nucleotide-binding/CBS domain-containing protein [Mycobacterium sp. SMC-4]|uniref:CBS domain-containing protein n=1 Tax=Mycobacterium sp. SMC-4 TaxID=2857059 RepID=UPI0021B46A65|nr:CBS domain-containing protein [Mycobacterium sp. SMC-4]UXA19919.1 CBS domain-containing protein [Mycobacterium sp. SMC-4]